MTVRFVDTSFWIALHLRRDGRHEQARLIWAGQPEALVTTTPVLGETWTFMRRRAGHGEALRLVEAVRGSPRVALIGIDDAVEREAWEWLRRHDERPYSFVDATSFAAMRRRRIREALAFDGDFSAAGFVEVRA